MAETKLRQYAVVERLNKMDVDLIIVSPSCDSDAIPHDDIIFNFTEIPNAVSVNGGKISFTTYTCSFSDISSGNRGKSSARDNR